MTINSFDSLFEQQSKSFGQPRSGFDNYRLGGSQYRPQAKEWFPNAVREGQVHFDSPFGQQSENTIDQHLSQEASIGHIWHHAGHDREDSSWDPTKTNYYDSNYRAGHPSTGLMQTIPATFKQYAVPGLTNIHDPLANLVAGIRYAQFDPKYRNRGGLDFVAARNSGY